MDFSNCACSGRSLIRLLRPAIMAVLADRPTHGYEIARRLADLGMFAQHRPDHAGIYRMLRSMQDEGLVTCAWELAESGPARRRFALTSPGRACLAKWADTLQEYGRAVAELLGVLRKVGRR